MASNADLAAPPSPDHLTLLFKHDKSTTLLSVLPTQSFPEIKEILLAVLKSRNVSTFPGSSVPLPDDASQIELGVLKDRKDNTKGWVPLVVREQQSSDVKAGKRKASGKAAQSNETPAGAHLNDGSWLVYRLAAQPETEDGDIDLDFEDPGWNVVLPSYDDEEEFET